MRKRIRIAVIAAAALCVIACADYAISSYQYYRWMANVVLGTNGYGYDTKKTAEVLKEMHPNALSQWLFKKKVKEMVENNAPHEETNCVIDAIFGWGLSSFSGRPCGVDMWTKDHDQQILMKPLTLIENIALKQSILLIGYTRKCLTGRFGSGSRWCTAIDCVSLRLVLRF